jgi:cyclophilin family peptidyl-prolyl cis-trans isomerase
VFGQVTEGLDVVKALDAVPVGGPNGDAPTNPPVIKSITIKEE